MTKQGQLKTREEQILCSIVNSYIESGQPVASGDISKLRRFSVSSASIRMIMAELAAEGYLQQPHTSAGRIPTEKAFQLFVDGLPSHRVSPTEVDRIRQSLNEAGSVEKRVERCSHMLVEMTDGLGITAALPATSQTLEQIELILLQARRVLMIVVTRDRMVRDRVVDLDEPVSQDDLAAVRNYVNFEFRGWAISDVRRELQTRLDQTAAEYNRTLRRLVLLYRKGLLEIDMQPEVRLDGAANVAAFDLNLTREHLRELLRALEGKRLVLRLLEQFLEEPPQPGQSTGPVRVKIGLDGDAPGMGKLSLIGVTVMLPGGTPAKLAVLGPMRMDYSRVMSAVLHVGRAFSSLPA